MTQEVGIYRGSFDPPHNGHLEAVNYSLKFGMSCIYVVYKDTNPYKPFRSSDTDRKTLLAEMFKGLHNISISEYGFKELRQKLQDDPTIQKIWRIVGSDVFEHLDSASTLQNKEMTLVIPRKDHPIPDSLPEDMRVIPPTELSQQIYSSTSIRRFFLQRQDSETLPMPRPVLDLIRERRLYHPTDAEYAAQKVLEEVRKIVEHEIGAKKIVALDLYPLSVRLDKDVSLGGMSGDIVSFILDKNKRPQFVVKIFQGNAHAKNYESELSGFQTIAQLNLKKVIVPTILFSHQREEFSLIGMTMAAGKPLTALLRDSIEAVRLSAQACVELHLARRQLSTRIGEDQVKIFDEVVTKVIGRLDDTLSISSKQLQERCSQIRQAFLSNPGLCSFTHGDPNAGNWIVDLESKRVTYIDLSLFSRSLSPLSNPCGFAINEYFEAISGLWIVGERVGLSVEAIDECQKAFSTEYLAHAPADIATPEASVYFESYWLLRGLHTLLKRLDAAQIDQKSETQKKIADKFARLLAL